MQSRTSKRSQAPARRPPPEPSPTPTAPPATTSSAQHPPPAPPANSITQASQPPPSAASSPTPTNTSPPAHPWSRSSTKQAWPAHATSPQLAALLREQNTKIIQIGDSRQLSGVPAGGSFTAISSRHDAARLGTALRQRDQEERNALDAIRLHEPADYLSHKLQTGELEITSDPADVPQRAADWWSNNAQEHGAENILVITRRSGAAAALNQHIRTARLVAGQLGPDAVTAAGRDYAVGDRIITRRNNPTLGLDNGTRGTVAEIDQQRRSITLRSDDERTLTIPSDYLDAGHVQHAYAQTAHLTQGSTAETALVVTTPDDHAAEWTYTAASRTRGQTRHLVLALEPDRQREQGDSRPLPADVAIATLVANMKRDQADAIATRLAYPR